jgi:hypothetical protein
MSAKHAKRTKFAGSSTFYMFEHLRNGAWSLFKSAQEHPEGSGHCRVSAVLFSAFAVEAYLNHIGEEQLSFWGIVERKLSWSDKLSLIASHLGVEIKTDERPFQTVKKVFGFRDKLAHGKTHELAVRRGRGREPDTDPEWLAEFGSDTTVRRAVDDTNALIKVLHEKSGSRHSLGLISSSAYFETTEKK